jgi:GntR family transcriptional regulator, transcriptional repressor for pyruvate dehydrogenase complex
MMKSKPGPATRLAGRARAADAIGEDLLGQIVSGALAHGSRLPPERTLAAQYGVSGATVREALQGLNVMGLVDVRHGSGTYVSALADTLVAKSLGTVIQLQGVNVQNLMGLLGALCGHAARLAVKNATARDIAELNGAIAALTAAEDVDAIANGVKSFIAGLATAAHDPLLLALVRFLLDVHLALVRESWSPAFAAWHKIVMTLQPDRRAIVDALKRRDGEELAARVTAFHARAVKMIARQGFNEVPVSDERLGRVLATLI